MIGRMMLKYIHIGFWSATFWNKSLVFAIAYLMWEVWSDFPPTSHARGQILY